MSALGRAAQARLRAWSARRHGADSLPLVVQVRRIYILPTASGLVLAALVIAMLLAGLNYNSNLALAFGFLMGSVALVVMHHCHRNLLGLRVDAETEADGFAGAAAALQFALRNDSRVDRYDIEIRCGSDAAATTCVPGASACRASVALPLRRRGVIRLRQFELRTTYPLGWFRAWSYVQAPLAAYAAPAPAGMRGAPPSPAARQGAAAASVRGDEDFAGLGAYTPGIPLKHMAWKVLARGGEAAVRNYAGAASEPLWLDWHDLEGIDVEARLAQLCRWILDGAQARRAYGLRLPGRELGPGVGAAHRQACLRALASFGVEKSP